MYLVFLVYIGAIFLGTEKFQEVRWALVDGNCLGAKRKASICWKLTNASRACLHSCLVWAMQELCRRGKRKVHGSLHWFQRRLFEDSGHRFVWLTTSSLFAFIGTLNFFHTIFVSFHLDIWVAEQYLVYDSILTILFQSLFYSFWPFSAQRTAVERYSAFLVFLSFQYIAAI